MLFGKASCTLEETLVVSELGLQDWTIGPCLCYLAQFANFQL